MREPWTPRCDTDFRSGWVCVPRVFSAPIVHEADVRQGGGSSALHRNPTSGLIQTFGPILNLVRCAGFRLPAKQQVFPRPISMRNLVQILTG